MYKFDFITFNGIYYKNNGYLENRESLNFRFKSIQIMMHGIPRCRLEMTWNITSFLRQRLAIAGSAKVEDE